MKTVAEIVNANYVLVPMLKNTNMGYMVTDRGDMTDYEWRVWRRTTEIRAVKQLVSSTVNGKKGQLDIRNGLLKIVDFLASEGVDSALVGTIAANDLRMKSYDSMAESTASFNGREL